MFCWPTLWRRRTLNEEGLSTPSLVGEPQRYRPISSLNGRDDRLANAAIAPTRGALAGAVERLSIIISDKPMTEEEWIKAHAIDVTPEK